MDAKKKCGSATCSSGVTPDRARDQGADPVGIAATWCDALVSGGTDDLGPSVQSLRPPQIHLGWLEDPPLDAIESAIEAGKDWPVLPIALPKVV